MDYEETIQTDGATERPEFQRSEREEFHIVDEKTANWYLRKQANLQSEIDRIKAQAAAMVRDLEVQKVRLASHYELELQRWSAEQLAAKGGRSKTLKLLQGSCSFRTIPASLRILSTTDAIEYARSQGWDVVKTAETLDGAAYRQQAEAARAESGEILPGIEVIPERETFAIRFPTAKGTVSTDEEAER